KLSGQVLHRRTGLLAGSVRVIPTQLRGTVLSGAVEGAGGPAFYGSIHEFGCGPFEVFAVNARALHFVSKGKDVFLTKVSHPGLPARPWMQPSLDENASMIETQLREALDQELNR